MPASTRALYYFPFWLLSSDGVEIPGNEALVAISVEFSACGKLQSSLMKKKKKRGKKYIIGSRTNLETESTGRFQCAFKFGDSFL